MRGDRCDVKALRDKQAAKKLAADKLAAEKAKGVETLKGVVERVKAIEALVLQ